MKQLFYGPGVTAEDVPRLLTQVAFLRQHMQPGVWYTLPELCESYAQATGRTMLETSASAQLRALRRSEHGGFAVERRLRDGAGPGLHEYSLVKPKPVRRIIEP